MSNPNKVLVIGASIAGAAICYWLKKFGFSPTLIEKYKTLRMGGYAVDIRGIAIDIARKMGIHDNICDKRTMVGYCRYLDADGNTLYQEDGESSGFRYGDEVEIVRGDLVEILMDTIKDVPCHFQQSVDAIKQHDNYVEVHFKDGKTERFDLVIGADGLHSSTRQMVFAKDVLY